MSKLIQLNHGAMSASISTLGAELQTLDRNGTQYLWHGDPLFWHGRSPILFPITGRVWNNEYRVNNDILTMKAHGFARDREFEVIEATEDVAVLALHSDDESFKLYPFKFLLMIKYTLTDRGLEVGWVVRNESDGEMPFQIGAHPALMLPDFDPDNEVRGYFSFEPKEEELTYLEPTDKGCVDPTKPKTLKLDELGMLPITAHTFDIDTYVMDSSKLTSCTLLSAERVPSVTVEFHMPVLSLWSPTLEHPACPFVCIEPWCGSADTIGYEGPFRDRRVMNLLEPGATFHTSYRIIIH